jgi:zinc protease
MISYQTFILDNGLQVYVHQDLYTPMAVVNILYNVGSRDEEENKTGFAHLFEHLMFGGSKNIPSYDEPLQKVGAENNAFTSPDITNYYITLPAVNIETAFWLESDRMMSLSFDPKVLETQQKVVIEEFKQRYLNQPYGDVWAKMRPLAYKNHTYRWNTIGKDISHIENATMNDVKDFFYTHYLPNNAILVVAGNVTVEQVKQLAKKWFEPIPAGKKKNRNLIQEERQTEARLLKNSAKVPQTALFKGYAMSGRYQAGFHTSDLLSDILGRGKSSRLYRQLLKEQNLFSSINAYVMASLDPGLLMVQGNLNNGVAIEDADFAVEQIVQELAQEILTEKELNKVKNQAETTLVMAEVDLLSRAMNLAFAANAGNVDWVNEDSAKIQAINPQSLNEMAKEVLRKENCSTMYYMAE